MAQRPAHTILHYRPILHRHNCSIVAFQAKAGYDSDFLENIMKKPAKVALFICSALILSSCATTNPQAQRQAIGASVAQESGSILSTALAYAIGQRCQSELNKNQYWQIAAPFFGQKQQAVQSSVCTCVGKEATKVASNAELATAVFDEVKRTQIAIDTVKGALQNCAVEVIRPLIAQP